MRTEFSFHHRLDEGLKRLGIQLDAVAVERLYRYFSELKKWNRKVNLIAKGSGDEQIVESHFLDSLTLLPLIDVAGVHLLDVGSGAGFPGLVLKAAKPEIRLTLVEPRLKRVSFLRHIVRSLELAEVSVPACRIEDEQQLPSDLAVSHITSRAVSDIGGFLTMIGRFGHPGLQVICMKGPKWQEELAAASEILADLPFGPHRAVAHTLPFSGAERVLLVFDAVDEA